MRKLRADCVPSDDEKFAAFRLLMNVQGMNATRASHEIGIDPSTGWGWAVYAGIIKPKKNRHWTRHQERLLLAAGKGKLSALAKLMGRTYFAAYRHRERLLKCSDAQRRAKG